MVSSIKKLGPAPKERERWDGVGDSMGLMVGEGLIRLLIYQWLSSYCPRSCALIHQSIHLSPPIIHIIFTCPFAEGPLILSPPALPSPPASSCTDDTATASYLSSLSKIVDGRHL